MASESEASCESDPNFAVICGFLEKFGVTCGLASVGFLDLQKMLENTHEAPQELIDLHIKLLRKARKYFLSERWENALIKICHNYSSQDAWELERFGYKKASLASKLRILKHLLEMQFDYNGKFKTEINKMSATQLRSNPMGRDKLGCAYWYQSDDDCQVRIYKEDPDEETWTLIAKNREGLVSLISELGPGDSIGSEQIVNEDSSSLEIEKPITDTGQYESNSSKSDGSKSDDSESENKKNESSKTSEAEAPEDEIQDNAEDVPIDTISLPAKLKEAQENSESGSGLDLTVKPTIGIRIKPLNELMAPKPEEPCGIKDKYMREDKAPTMLRMAVESAGFEIHKADYNHPEVEESYQELHHTKKPRLSRPTLLGNKMLSTYPDEMDRDIEEEIEEPIMLIKGSGNGVDNQSGFHQLFVGAMEETPIVGEEIEEPIFYVNGEGSGAECTTGKESLKTDDKNTKQEIVQTDHEETCNSIIDLDKSLESECSPSKTYKLGTVIDVKTDHTKYNTPSKNIIKSSRWDMEKIPEHNLISSKDVHSPVKEDVHFSKTGEVQHVSRKSETVTTTTEEQNRSDNEGDSIVDASENAPKGTMFFFGPKSLSSSFSCSNKSQEQEDIAAKPDLTEDSSKDTKIGEDKIVMKHLPKVAECSEKFDNISTQHDLSTVHKAEDSNIAVVDEKTSDPQTKREKEVQKLCDSKQQNKDEIKKIVVTQVKTMLEVNKEVQSNTANTNIPNSVLEHIDETKLQKEKSHEIVLEKNVTACVTANNSEILTGTSPNLCNVPSGNTTKTDSSSKEDLLQEKASVCENKADKPEVNILEEKCHGKLNSFVAMSEQALDSTKISEKQERTKENTTRETKEISNTNLEGSLLGERKHHSAPEVSSNKSRKGELIKIGTVNSLQASEKIDKPLEDNLQEKINKAENNELVTEGKELRNNLSLKCKVETGSGELNENVIQAQNEDVACKKDSQVKILSIEHKVPNEKKVISAEPPVSKGNQKTKKKDEEKCNNLSLENEEGNIEKVISTTDNRNATPNKTIHKTTEVEDLNVPDEQPVAKNKVGKRKKRTLNICKDESSTKETLKKSNTKMDDILLELKTKAAAIGKKCIGTKKETLVFDKNKKPCETDISVNVSQTVIESNKIDAVTTPSENTDKSKPEVFEHFGEVHIGTTKGGGNVSVPVEKRQTEKKEYENIDEDVKHSSESIRSVEGGQIKKLQKSIAISSLNKDMKPELLVLLRKSDQITDKIGSETIESKAIVEPIKVAELVPNEGTDIPEVKNTLAKATPLSNKTIVDVSAVESTQKRKSLRNAKEAPQLEKMEKNDEIKTVMTKDNSTKEMLQEENTEVILHKSSESKKMAQKSNDAKKKVTEKELNLINSKYEKQELDANSTESNQTKKENEEQFKKKSEKGKSTLLDPKCKNLEKNSKESAKGISEEENIQSDDDMNPDDDAYSDNCAETMSDENVEIKTNEDFEESIENARKEQHKIQNKKHVDKKGNTNEDFEDSIENARKQQMRTTIKKEKDVGIVIKTNDDFEDSIEVKKIKLTDAIAAKNLKIKKEKPATDTPVRRTRAATRRLASGSDKFQEPAEKPKDVADEELSTDDGPPSKPPLTLSNFKLDVDDDSPPPRTAKKRVLPSPPTVPAATPDAKRRKMKGKRSVDLQTRKNVEKQKDKEVSSSDDDVVEMVTQNVVEDAEAESQISPKKKTGRPKGSGKKKLLALNADIKANDSEETAIQTVKKDPTKRNSRMLLGLEVPDGDMGVRQSRRIAQIKIKEEAERRKIEDLTLPELEMERKKKYKGKKNEDMDYKAEKRKRDKPPITEDDTTQDIESDEKKKKKKRKHARKLFDEANPWRSSSDSSSSNEEEEEEEEHYSEVEQVKSDHEFSPESDLEDNAEMQPLKRARTVRKESDVDETVDDYNCQKCGKTDHPEWILLCDGCDNGWHCSCLRPPLLVIPEGDWYCPPCQHITLTQNLHLELRKLDLKINKRAADDRRKERLAYVGISLDNVLRVKEDKKRKVIPKNAYESKSEESISPYESSSDADSSDSDEPVYQLRQRRQAHCYRFNDYDDLINSAIQDEMEAVKGVGIEIHGKDMSTIIKADSEVLNAQTVGETELEPLPPVVPKNTELPLAVDVPKAEDSEEEAIKPVTKTPKGKRHRKLNSLDVSSGDDADSDEDFKGNSSDEDDDIDEDFGSDSSDQYGRSTAVRRSTRARVSRYDKDFIDDDSDDAPKKRKNRSIWDESESEESDQSWGSRKRKTYRKPRKHTSPKRKKKSKKKKSKDDSETETYGKKRPKIKYGLDDDDEDTGRKTRGRKITYVDALGSDSDEGFTKKAPPKIEDSEEEFVLNEEDDLENEKESEEDMDGDESADELDEESAESKKEEQNLTTDDQEPDANLTNDVQNTPIIESTSKQPPAPIEPEIAGTADKEEFEEPNPIEEINKNVEEMDEKEMEMMIEDEEYANRQLQLVAVQIEKERKRKEREAQKLEKINNSEPKVPKKRGRKPASAAVINLSAAVKAENLAVGEALDASFNSTSEDVIPNSSPDTPKKRRGRGKGRKTLAAEAAAATPKDSPQNFETSSNSSSQDTPLQGGKLGIAAPPQPFTQSQPAPSVITRMLQNQQNYAGVGPKIFAATGESRSGAKHSESAITPGTNVVTPPNTVPAGHFIPGPRGVNAQYRPPSSGINFPIPRSGPTQSNQPLPLGPQGMSHIYHSHHPMDPSPSGGGPIILPGRSSPSNVLPAPSGPLVTKTSSTPPPYARSQIVRYPPSNNVPPMNNPSALPPRPILMGHIQPPRGRLSPYQSTIPTNYHFSAFPPNLSEDGASPSASYSNSYEQFPAESAVDGKNYEEDSEGEFGGLVSYFSSQREDDLDT